MAHPILYYKGTIEAFQEEFGKLDKSSKKYKDIISSVVYISENIDEENPESLENFEGAIFAKGAIIAGSANPEWENEIEGDVPEE